MTSHLVSWLAKAAIAGAFVAPPAPAQMTSVSSSTSTPANGSPGAADLSRVAPYAVLDDLQAPWTNLNLVPLRAFTVTPDDAHVYAVNVHDSTVRHFDFIAGSPAISTWRMPWGPVSVALYDAHPDGIQRLLVVCRGTHALAIVDRFLGDVLELVDLPFEPADVLVDEASPTAFISCSGARVVVELDLVTLQQTIHAIPAIEPSWLAWSPDGRVLVAPLISGNNSTTIVTAGNESLILDLDDPQIAPAGGLPDQDLFAIDPSNGSVTAVSRGAGSVLFAHGVNPASGRHWQLNLDSINKRAGLQSEPALNGIFADNRLTLTTLPGPGGPIASAHDFVYLDDSDPSQNGIQFDTSRTIGLPTGLTFSSGGYGLACGVSTDNVMILAPGPTQAEGGFIFEWDLPDGSIPRYAMFDPLGETLAAVYCWGTNQILVYTFNPFTGVPALTLDLGFDPTPPQVKEGRRVFHDASKSLHNNLTCGSCHIEGGSDYLAWNLSGKPHDTKGPLYTQTLFGIERLAPFHWRGERPVLEDFNGAFTGLLGGPSELSAAEFAQFKSYVFSLTSPANRGADEHRVLNDALAQPLPNAFVGSAVRGQDKFMNLPSDGALTCMSCHSLPTASDNDLISEEATLIPSMSHMEVTAFNELEDKDQPIVPVVFLGQTHQKPLLGFGLLHDGTINSRFNFVNDIFGQITEQDRADITEFVIQFDSGLGRGVHRAQLLDAAHLASAAAIRGYLIDQAQKGNVSLAAVGTYPTGGPLQNVAWLYDKKSKKFLPDDSDFAPATMDDFVRAARDDGASNVFVGLPPGDAERFAIDYDLDGLANQDESDYFTNPLRADSDFDSYFDGLEVKYGSNPASGGSVPSDPDDPVVKDLEVVWATAKNARVTFRTNEPCSASIDFSTAGGPVRTVATSELAKVHNLLLPELLPSTFGILIPPEFEVFHDYTGTLTVTDDSGRVVQVPLPTFTTEPFILLGGTPPVTVIGDFDWGVIGRTLGGGLTASGSVHVDFKVAGPPPIVTGGAVVVGNILVNGQIVPFGTTTSPSQTFQVFSPFGFPPGQGQHVNFTSLPGPFLITLPTGANGDADFQFSLGGLATGDLVRFNVIGVFFPDFGSTYDPADPKFGSATGNPFPAMNWSIGDTPKDLRGIELVY